MRERLHEQKAVKEKHVTKPRVGVENNNSAMDVQGRGNYVPGRK